MEIAGRLEQQIISYKNFVKFCIPGKNYRCPASHTLDQLATFFSADRLSLAAGRRIAFLRKSSLDELPQLWSILKGDMSFVGPRPALFNQEDLITLRTQRGVHELVPGLTGWAQVNGRDELPIPQKVQFDTEYLERRSLAFDLKILWLTALKVLVRDGVSH